MNNVLDAGWRALAYCLHPRVIVLTLVPVLVAASVAVVLGHFYWDSLLQSVAGYLDGWTFITAMFAWLEPFGIGDMRRLIVPIVVFALSLVVLILITLVMVSLLMTPALVKLVGRRRFPLLERKKGGSLLQSMGFSVSSTLIALAIFVVTIPLWLVPPLIAVLPPAIWGWLTFRVMAYDTLAEYASEDERRNIMRGSRWPLMGIGVACAYLGAVPLLIWAAGFMALALAPVLVVVSVWLYTLVFAFSALWFSHYGLAQLDRLRSSGSAGSVNPHPTLLPH